MMIFLRLFLVYLLPLGIMLGGGTLAKNLYPGETGQVLGIAAFVLAGVVCFYFHRRTRKWPDWEWLPPDKW